MDDQHDFRGWDLWLENGKRRPHIIHKWPDDALKVVATNELHADKWTHVFVTYDGSGKAAGVKVYVNGQPQATSVAGRHPEGHDPDDGPVQGRPAAHRVAARRRRRSRTCGSTAGRSPPTRSSSSPGDRAARPGRQAADEADRRRERTRCSTGGSATSTSPTTRPRGEARRRSSRSRRRSRRAGTVAHVMQRADRSRPMAFVLYRGEYDKRRDQVKAEHARRPAADAAGPARATGSASRSGCCGPNTR